MFKDTEHIITTIILEAEAHRIIYYRHPHKSNKLIITFDAHGHDIRDKGFGSEMLTGAGYDHIFVSHAVNSQYQSLSIAEFHDAVYNVSQSYETFTYGSSLGGYCAIYYAGCIGAKAIAISPRNSAHPSIRNPIFSELIFTHQDIIQNPISFFPPTVIYDPFQSVDLSFLYDQILPAYPNTQLIEIPYAGHLIAEALLEIGALKDFTLSIIEGGIVPPINLSTENSSYFCAEIAESYLAKGEYTEAAILLEASLKIRHDNTHLDRLILLIRDHIPDHPVSSVFNPYIDIISQSPLFDQDWYLENYSDIAADTNFAHNPLIHYLIFGAAEGRNPSSEFNSDFYLQEYPDVNEGRINPLVHYLIYGQFEGRTIQKAPINLKDSLTTSG